LFDNKQLMIVESKVKNESDLINIRYRIMMILEKYQE